VVEHKDVVVTLLGVSAGLAGLVLVFLGLVVTAYQAFAADTPASILDRYQRSASLALVSFAFGVVCVALATGWLVDLGDNRWLYRLTVAAFFAQLVVLVVATMRSVWQILWED
jgi:hypothetical protein